MRSNRQLALINRNFLACFAVAASISAAAAQLMAGQESYLNTTLTIAVGYAAFFGMFSALFYRDNRARYRGMGRRAVLREVAGLATSFGAGEAVFLAVRWPTLYYFLELGMEPYLASLASDGIATACFMGAVTLFLRRSGTF